MGKWRVTRKCEESGDERSRAKKAAATEEGELAERDSTGLKSRCRNLKTNSSGAKAQRRSALYVGAKAPTPKEDTD